eukprot:gene12901-8761_t
MEGVSRDAAAESAKQNAETWLRSVLPRGAPAAAFAKARQYVQQHPVDELIASPVVQVTHILNTSGEEEKSGWPKMDLEEAKRRASDRQLNLVMMARKDDVAFCRIRDEKAVILALVKKELEAAEEQASGAPKKVKNMIQHPFRDVVDAHFIGWKSKKIVEDLKKGHPVKLVIREFQNWEAALLKLQEMCAAMQKVAESGKIPHHFTGITASSTEASIIFSPPAPGSGKAVIRYPGNKEWENARKRMEDACRKSGRFGTYMKTGALKPRSLGQTTYRVDKYGRRIQ